MPNPMLPMPTEENAITQQMIFQLEVIKRLDLIAASLQKIAASVETTTKKQF
jgi:hypothetical protein